MQPNYPQYPAPPMPQYPPQQAPYGQYPPQAPQYPPAPAPAPAAPGSLDGFFGQPAGAEGPSFKFKDRPNGTSYSGIVARQVTDSDVRTQTDRDGRPQTFRDGRPKQVMVVPMVVQPSPEFPEGRASWWVAGGAKDELVRAMAEAGAPAGPPEAGAAITVTKVGERPIPGFNPKYLYRIEYLRPEGAGQAAPAAPAPAVEQSPAQAAPAAPVEQTPAVAPATGGLDAEQQALLSKLTGSQS